MERAVLSRASGSVPSVLVSDVTIDHVAWLARGWVPRAKGTLLDGDLGVGKSAVTLDLAARVSAGPAIGHVGNVPHMSHSTWRPGSARAGRCSIGSSRRASAHPLRSVAGRMGACIRRERFGAGSTVYWELPSGG